MHLAVFRQFALFVLAAPYPAAGKMNARKATANKPADVSEAP
jgi:hypothetical protein